MTTTAEKIKELEERGELLLTEKTRYGEAVHHFIEEVAKLRKKINDAKPPGPEPLECWVNVWEDGDLMGPVHPTEDSALRHSDCNKSHYLHRAVEMREVTPQDEQDRKDAARYRYLKKAAQLCSTEAPIYMDSPDNWDERIDKAMERE